MKRFRLIYSGCLRDDGSVSLQWSNAVQADARNTRPVVLREGQTLDVEDPIAMQLLQTMTDRTGAVYFEEVSETGRPTVDYSESQR